MMEVDGGMNALDTLQHVANVQWINAFMHLCIYVWDDLMFWIIYFNIYFEYLFVIRVIFWFIWRIWDCDCTCRVEARWIGPSEVAARVDCGLLETGLSATVVYVSLQAAKRSYKICNTPTWFLRQIYLIHSNSAFYFLETISIQLWIWSSQLGTTEWRWMSGWGNERGEWPLLTTKNPKQLHPVHAKWWKCSKCKEEDIHEYKRQYV